MFIYFHDIFTISDLSKIRSTKNWNHRSHFLDAKVPWSLAPFAIHRSLANPVTWIYIAINRQVNILQQVSFVMTVQIIDEGGRAGINPYKSIICHLSSYINLVHVTVWNWGVIFWGGPYCFWVFGTLHQVESERHFVKNRHIRKHRLYLQCAFLCQQLGYFCWQICFC